MHGDTQEVRPAEQLDWEALARYLRWNLPSHLIKGLDLSGDMQVSQFPGGHSNLTYLVRLGGGELVVRRPPMGPVAPTAHDVAREYRWLAAINPVFPLAPRPYLLCEDPSVIGAPFCVMERRRGLVVRHEEPLPLRNHPQMRRRVGEALVDTLADLHAVDAAAPQIARLGRPAGFVGRQIRGWSERWHASKISESKDVDDLAVWLAAHVPPDPSEPTIVHGDFKLDNVLLDPLEPARVVAVFDWEMSALGDPLVDLGILLAYWSATGPGGRDATVVTEREGWPSRDAIVDRYAARSDREVSHIRFYETFALFKIAVVVQQIFFRYSRGHTADPRFETFGDRVGYLARRAMAIAETRQ
jgi:aminoglycoside phosphotransferase (APT) family kinase protein